MPLCRFPFLAFLCLSTELFATAPGASEAKAIMAVANQRIVDFHTGEPDSGAVLRLVYFHPADRAPLADHEARLDRVMTDIAAFYREGLQAFGVTRNNLPLETRDGKIVLHHVRGRHPASHYLHESGDETWAEVKRAVSDRFTPKREHVLILYGLCHREPDGRYVFNAPYYGAGWSDHRSGLCHAADCEILDPQLLTKKKESMVFTEHYYPRREMSVAGFNTLYLGGIAHELGHGLGFPHDNGGPNEGPGDALMGWGNHHYREDRWGGKKPTYLSLATALRLAAHPLITQSDKARWQEADADFSELETVPGKNALRITGRVRASVPPCAVIASAWPAKAKSNHGAMTFCAAVADDGRFTVEITHLQSGTWKLDLGGLLVNGAETTRSFNITVDRRGQVAPELVSRK